MKELSIKEKAEAYDLAIERAKKWYNAPNIDKMPTYGNRIIEEIFPELIESEDERIRKEIYWFFTQPDTVCDKRWLAWLEKQNPIMAKSPQLGGQKSSWSEEDDIMKQNCHQMLALLRPNSSELIKDIIDNCHHWLKSLKNRVQPKQEWSEEDKSKVQRICKYLDEAKKYYADITEVRECMDWLKSLKQRIGG